MTSRWTLILLVACGGLVGAGVAPAGAPRPGIALDHRIGAVSYAEPKARVEAALGHGVGARLDGHRFVSYPKAGIYIDYVGHRGRKLAVVIVTRSPRYKTGSGVGVGSTLGQLRQRIKVTCYDPAPSPTKCQHERANINLPFTVFDVDPATKRVTEIAVVPGGD